MITVRITEMTKNSKTAFPACNYIILINKIFVSANLQKSYICIQIIRTYEENIIHIIDIFRIKCICPA